MSILNQPIVLVVNSNWQAIGTTTPKKALVAMCSSFDGENLAAKAIAIDYPLIGTEYDFENPSINPVFFEDWIKLKIRSFDNVIRTARMEIRVPTVLLAHNYTKMPMKQLRPTKSGIWSRDNGICQITGEKVSHKTGNIGHNIARAKGGKDSWENMFLVRKELNSLQGTKTVAEMGWKFKKQPKAPLAVPASSLIREVRHKDWELFLPK